jgi:hypothetical protein
MKQVLFILLVLPLIISCKTVKVEEIGLEVMKKDLGEMRWSEAKKACADLGDGWRLPTIEEFEKMYKYKDEIGGFEASENSHYWSSTEGDVNGLAWFFNFYYGGADHNLSNYRLYVRAVRDLK